MGLVSSSSSSTSSSSSGTGWTGLDRVGQVGTGWTGAGGISTGADSSSLADVEEEGEGEAGLSEERWST